MIVPKPLPVIRPKFKRLPQRPNVTICIAIACETNVRSKIPACVLITDRAISLGGMTSVETGVKGRRITRLWNALLAGDDISFAESVLKNAQARISDRDADIPYVDLQRLFASAYQETRVEIIKNRYLSSFGWTLSDFMQHGKSSLPESEFGSLLAEMQKFDLGCEFLVAGFKSGKAKFAQMFYASNPGVVIPQDFYHFGAIGSGAPNAYAYLARREQKGYFSLEETIYNGIAAKVLAEKAIGIGRDTQVIVTRPDGSVQTIDEGLEEVREIWTNEEENVRPANLESRIKKLIKLVDF